MICEDGPVRVTVRRQAGAETVRLLQQTIYGTSGPRYQHTGQAQKVHEIAGRIILKPGPARNWPAPTAFRSEPCGPLA